jgi:MFS transporter, SP family, general alpha glucoside:H+ symporter
MSICAGSWGQLISSGILRGLFHREDDWAWRIPYAIQWAWPVPIIIGAFLAPESPVWLVKKGRIDDARQSLRRLTSKKVTHEMIENKLTMINHTDELEKSMGEDASYLDCLKGTNLRRIEIACVLWISQVFCGIWFGGYVVYFLELAGNF